MKKVLIITHQNDNYSIEKVTRYLEAQGAQVVRFNTDLYPSEVCVSQYINNGELKTLIRTNGSTYLLDEFEAIWYRRFYLGQALDHTIPVDYRKAILEESRRVMLGVMETSEVFKLDDYRNVRRTSDKHLQLKLAQAIGMRIPNTLVTNDATELEAFYEAHPQGIITKMQSSFAIYQDGVESVVFTNRVEAAHLEEKESLQISPMKFQESIEKQLELRVTIVGDQLFTYAIDSQQLKGAHTDWRREGANFIDQWKPYSLPVTVESQMLQLMDELGLNYGAADLILTPEDEYVFLEVNPVGEFFWLDKLSGGQIASAIADLLVGKGKRRVMK